MRPPAGRISTRPAGTTRPSASGSTASSTALDEAHSFMDRPAADSTLRSHADLSDSIPPSSDPAPGATGTLLADRYLVGEPIGRGGMGTVYRAEQLRPVKRPVAVKLINPGMDSRSVLARFEAERQALAVMDHPHIAKVLDAGATPDGRPFFVMELVDGVPLTDYCDARRLPVAGRLDLFRQVCGAVQHAHQKGVIHRDIKPSNVLVEERGGSPVPKVIDFGLAKAVGGAALTDQTLFTAPGSAAGTPLYMAPEQAGPDARDVDTRADVYALGAVLYELLTGSPPIGRETLRRAALHEVFRLIREDDPPPPSSRLGSSDDLPTVAVNRGTEPARLGRSVRGDLDWVVMKALEKDRGRRYESAAALADDVQRFLNHEPVAAGPPTLRYRAAKFVRRNRGAVTAAAARPRGPGPRDGRHHLGAVRGPPPAGRRRQGAAPRGRGAGEGRGEPGLREEGERDPRLGLRRAGPGEDRGVRPAAAGRPAGQPPDGRARARGLGRRRPADGGRDAGHPRPVDEGPGRVRAGDRPAGEGRRHPRRRGSARTTARPSRAGTTWRRSTAPPAASTRPCPSSSGRWRRCAPGSAPTTPTPSTA